MWVHDSRCLADGVYLPLLADKFARLVMQLQARYALWLAEGVSARRAASAAGPTQDPAGAVAQVNACLLLSVSICAYCCLFPFMPTAVHALACLLISRLFHA